MRRRVSRSFDLSLRLLPGSVRPTLSLAYLLARASDSIADVARVPVSERLRVLRALPGAWPGEEFVRAAEKGLPEADRELLLAMPGLLVRLEESPDRGEIEHVWATIRSGQIFDMERFGGEAAPLTLDEAETYAGLVAGCVGEFWTDVCFKHVPGYSEMEPGKLRALGYSFGCGLQWVNILRDRADDAGLGRVYVTPGNVTAATELARRHLADGRGYASAVRPRRLRAACVLPCRLGESTLDLIETRPGERRVKVGRWVVWRSLLEALR